MDISSIDFRDTATLELKHPVSGEVLKDDNHDVMTVTVKASHSDDYKRAMFEFRSQKVLTEESDFDDSEDAVIDLLAKLTVDWNIQIDGKHPKCTKDEAKKVYAKVKWIREQVDLFIHDRRNFFSETSAD